MKKILVSAVLLAVLSCRKDDTNNAVVAVAPVDGVTSAVYDIKSLVYTGSVNSVKESATYIQDDLYIYKYSITQDLHYQNISITTGTKTNTLVYWNDVAIDTIKAEPKTTLLYNIDKHVLGKSVLFLSRPPSDNADTLSVQLFAKRFALK